jgi:uncharacterized protein
VTAVFADSSALVKLYADEPGHEVVRGLGAVVVSRLARVEVPAALWRKGRTRELSTRLAGVLVTRFEHDWFGHGDEPPRFAIVRTSTPVLEDAARLTAVHALRGYDAVHLASALAVRRADPSVSTIAVFDRDLRTAAVTEGLTVLP